MTTTTAKETPSPSKESASGSNKTDKAAVVHKEEAPDFDKIKAKDLQEIEKDPRVSFGPPKIQTAEDAREAYLRQEIDAEELKALVGKYGTFGEQLWVSPNRLERGDEAFERTLPDALFTPPAVEISDVEKRVKDAERKQEVRDAATDASEEVVREAKPQVDLGELQNERARLAAEEVEEKHQKERQKEDKDGPSL